MRRCLALVVFLVLPGAATAADAALYMQSLLLRSGLQAGGERNGGSLDELLQALAPLPGVANRR